MNEILYVEYKRTRFTMNTQYAFTRQTYFYFFFLRNISHGGWMYRLCDNCILIIAPVDIFGRFIFRPGVLLNLKRLLKTKKSIPLQLQVFVRLFAMRIRILKMR